MENHLRVVFLYAYWRKTTTSNEFALYYKFRYHSNDRILSDTHTAQITEKEKKYEKDDGITGRYCCVNSL